MEQEQDNKISFLDVLISRQADETLETSVYRKPTFSGLLLKWDSYVPKQYKKSLVQGFICRAWRLCSSFDKFHSELDYIRSLLRANGYPLNFIESNIHKFLNKCYSPPGLPLYGPEKKEVFVTLPFCGLNSDKIKRQLHRMMATIAPWIKLTVIFKPAKTLKTLCRLKSPLPVLSRSNVVYKVNCSECPDFYIGKTIRILQQRLTEHSKDENSALARHYASTGHTIEFDNPSVLASDNHESRLYVKESLLISRVRN